jgi:hypothetical protein
MQKIQVDQGLGERLLGLSNDVILCDEQGRVLGYFSPAKPSISLEEIARTSPRSMQEIEEQCKQYAGKRPEEVGKPLNEILTRLGLR